VKQPVRAESPVATWTALPVARAVPLRPARSHSIRRHEFGPLKDMGRNCQFKS
jgi:hypothetical protein